MNKLRNRVMSSQPCDDITAIVNPLIAALDAAQDEIERLISEKEALRERLEWEQPEPDPDVIGVSAS